MGESVLPLPVRAEPPIDGTTTGRAVGEEIAGILRYHLSVIDREDRLESGTGDWLTDFASDRQGRVAAAHESVLRAFQMATDARYFPILDALTDSGHLKTSDLVEVVGIGRLTAQERVADLVSAGLTAKVPEADQVSITSGGAAVVRLVREATNVAARGLEEGA